MALMSAEQPELELLWAAHDKTLSDQFLLTATDYGIKRWERMLKIYPKDTDGLEMRRARVLAMLRLKLPFTIRWLRAWLTELCGPDNYRLELNYYSIDLDLGYDTLPEAEKLAIDIVGLLSEVKPANMVLDFNAMRQSIGAVKAGGLTESAVLLEVWPAQTDLDSIGGVKLGAAAEFVVVLEVWPDKRDLELVSWGGPLASGYTEYIAVVDAYP
jgi:hypothetical protein